MTAKLYSTEEVDLWLVFRTAALVAAGFLLSGYWRAFRSFWPAMTHEPSPIRNGGPIRKERAQDSDSDTADEELSRVRAGFGEACKMVLCVRTDLGMSTGKIAAQCSHATLACYKQLTKSNPLLVKHWETTGQAKIALRVDSEDQLLVLQAQAQSLGICARTIQDAGRTQVAPGSTTVLGIGPAPVALVDQVTGSLRLL